MHKKFLLKQCAVLSVLIGVSVSGCSGGSINWQEEVKLSDGRVIVVDREAIYVSGGGEWASNRDLKKIDGHRIRFVSSDAPNTVVEWKSTKKSPMTYPETPLIFDMPNNEPTVFSLVAISNGCEVYSKYVYRNNVWIEEELPEHFEQQTTNLLFGSQRDLPERLTLAEKAKRNSKRSYRQAVKQVGPSRKVCG
jgi:hypothetical protein